MLSYVLSYLASLDVDNSGESQRGRRRKKKELYFGKTGWLVKQV